MTRSTRTTLLALTLVGCGGDEEGDGEEPKPSCSFGATLSGDVSASLSDADDAACLIAHSFGAGIDVVFAIASDVSSIELGIDDVAESEIGDGFPASIRINLDAGPRYATPVAACTANISEHELESTETSNIGEMRNYRVIGTATCTEPAFSAEPAGGAILIGGASFRIPAVWRD
jgi:hypothetical protein